MSLYENINKKKKAGTSFPNSKKNKAKKKKATKA